MEGEQYVEPLLTADPNAQSTNPSRPRQYDHYDDDCCGNCGNCGNCNCGNSGDSGEAICCCFIFIVGIVILGALLFLTAYFLLGYLGEVFGSVQNACYLNSDIRDRIKPIIMIASTVLITWGFIALYRHNFFSGVFGELDKAFIDHPNVKLVWQLVFCTILSLVGVFMIRAIAVGYDMIVQRYSVSSRIKHKIQQQIEGYPSENIPALYEAMHKAEKSLNATLLGVTPFWTSQYSCKQEIKKVWLTFENAPSINNAENLKKSIAQAGDYREKTFIFF